MHGSTGCNPKNPHALDRQLDRGYTEQMVSATFNPPSKFLTTHVTWEEAPKARLHLYEDSSKTILSENNSEDISFRYSVNPYRGCFHACTYCYARPSHEYLGFGAGTDFDRNILVKRTAPALLERTFRRPTWKGDSICFSGNTDCYQPIEHTLQLTQSCLNVCLQFQNPVGIITKSSLILRDIALLQELHQSAGCHVVVSIPFLDPADARAIEPNAPPPRRRLSVVKSLAAAGIPVGVSLGPIIPGLNDRAIPAILKAARSAGASTAWMIPIRLVGPVAIVFETRLRERLPEKADRVMNAIREMRRGDLGGGGVGQRMHGHGPAWAATVQLFNIWKARLGFPGFPPRRVPSPFRIPGHGAQVPLFSSAAS